MKTTRQRVADVLEPDGDVEQELAAAAADLEVAMADAELELAVSGLPPTSGAV